MFFLVTACFAIWFESLRLLTLRFTVCRACVVANDKLLVIGGQEGDFMAKPNSPIFKCSRRREVYIPLQSLVSDFQ